MIKANDVEGFFPRVFLAAHQFFGSNQKTVAFRFLFASVRNGIRLADLLASVFEAAEHQAAAFKRVVALAMGPHLVFVLFFELDQRISVYCFVSVRVNSWI